MVVAPEQRFREVITGDLWEVLVVDAEAGHDHQVELVNIGSGRRKTVPLPDLENPDLYQPVI